MRYLFRGILVLALLDVPTQITLASSQQEAPTTVEIHAKRFAFSPAEITIHTGQPTTLRLISDDVPHSLVVPALGINLQVSKGHPAEMTITPTRSGTFPGQCGRFCGSGHGSMLFKIEVRN